MLLHVPSNRYWWNQLRTPPTTWLPRYLLFTAGSEHTVTKCADITWCIELACMTVSGETSSTDLPININTTPHITHAFFLRNCKCFHLHFAVTCASRFPKLFPVFSWAHAPNSFPLALKCTQFTQKEINVLCSWDMQRWIMKSCSDICLSVCIVVVAGGEYPTYFISLHKLAVKGKLQWNLGRQSVNDYYLSKLWGHNPFCQPMPQLHNHCLNF